jgi:hypothetical protein
MLRVLAPALVLIALLGVLSLPGAVSAYAPVRGSHDDVFVDPDFCGTGMAVTVHASNAFVAHETVRGGLLYFSTNYSGVTRYTYAPTGKTATATYAAHSKDQTIVVNGNGMITIREAVSGLSERLTLPDGTVAYSDRGWQVFEFVIDTNGTPLDASDDIFVADHGLVSSAGPHPSGPNGDALFCTLLPAALRTP